MFIEMEMFKWLSSAGQGSAAVQVFESDLF